MMAIVYRSTDNSPTELVPFAGAVLFGQISSPPRLGEGSETRRLHGWAERIRTFKRQVDEVLGTSAEFSCTAEAI